MFNLTSLLLTMLTINHLVVLLLLLFHPPLAGSVGAVVHLVLLIPLVFDPIYSEIPLFVGFKVFRRNHPGRNRPLEDENLLAGFHLSYCRTVSLNVHLHLFIPVTI